MPDKTRQSFLQSALILTVAMMVVKVIGMLYKIPLNIILGGVGMAYFNTAYNIFSPVYALSIAGFPAAISKLVSENAARGQWRSVRRISRVSFLLLTAIGAVSFCVLFFGSGHITRLVENPEARIAVAAIAPSIFFCCLMAGWRGYYQGLSKMTPTAVSQVLEALAKLICGIALARYVIGLGMRQYEQTGTVFGAAADSLERAGLLVLPWAAAAAVLGVSLSTVLGCLYLFLRRLIRGDGISRETLAASPAPKPAGIILRGLTAVALPICLASMISHVTNLVDVATVMHRVGAAMEQSSDTILSMYRGLIPPELEHGEVPTFLYGSYGYAVSIFNLVPSLTTALGISALPMLASHWSVGNRQRAEEQIRSVIKLTALLAIPAGLGIAALAQPILQLLYSSREAEVAIAAPILRTLGFAAVFVGIVTPINSIFQAIGKTIVPVKLMAVGAVLKIACNYVLISIPSLNVRAVPYGTLLCYGFIFFASLYALRKEAGIQVQAAKILLKPLFCGIICMIAAHTSYGLLSQWTQSRMLCLVCIGISMIIYAVFVLFLKIITQNEALMLPNGKKVVKILEKLSFLG